MDTGIYVALSRETGVMRDMEVTANNLANMTTTGYDSEDLLFSDYLVPGTQKENTVAMANDIATYRDTSEGTLQETNAPLDAAIQGRGYFVVQTPLGTRYTRNGNFKTNDQGELVTSDGYPVLDDGGQPILFSTNDVVIQIRDDGTINVDNGDRAILKIVDFPNEQLLQKAGNNYYTSTVPPIPAQNFKVINGVLERSNVQPIAAMTHLMYISRAATDTANFINTMYTLERKASDTLAKIYS
jgi:flagellar basal-body rod protein FlgF